MKKRTHSPAKQKGFALVIALSLMGFILLLLLSIATFVRVESLSSAAALSQLEARQNALLGLQVALGELQRSAGPDQRVTATGDLLAGTHISRRNLAGVWDSTDGTFLQWLVSDFDRENVAINFVQTEALDPDLNNVVLVGGGSALADADNRSIVVNLNNTGILSEAGTVGRYGWWIGDEGVKARVNVDNPFEVGNKQYGVLAL
ncbi:MAG: hypothetical protein EA353_06720, partial [Puniceicoccaceae bacterium]